MTRYLKFDEDKYRLPEGMLRVGYDADTERYTYRDAEGTYWQGAPGARYGTLQKALFAGTPQLQPNPVGGTNEAELESLSNLPTFGNWGQNIEAESSEKKQI